ncbi:MAG: DUF5119 domain-containing protein [Bacteroides sp.]|nr:DUF5119 domain-containing protein [Bacteroides sp.]
MTAVTDYNNLRKSVLICVICGALFSSCDRRELTYYLESEITVTADWSRADQEEEKDYGATLVIYPQDGVKPRVVLMGARNGTTVRLPKGRYDMVLFNRSFDDFGAIEFRGREAFGILESCARKKADTRTGTRVVTSTPEKLASAVIRDFEVTEEMLGNYASASSPGARGAAATCPEGSCRVQLVPAPLTYKVKVEMHIKGINNLRQAMCTLDGVPLSVFLCDGSPGREQGSQEFAMGHPVVDENSPTEGTLTGTLNLFGEPDEQQLHSITMKALLVDGKTVVEQQITNLSVSKDKDERNVVTLHLEAVSDKPLPDVKPEAGGNPGFDVDMEDWGDEQHGDIDA